MKAIKSARVKRKSRIVYPFIRNIHENKGNFKSFPQYGLSLPDLNAEAFGFDVVCKAELWALVALPCIPHLGTGAPDGVPKGFTVF
jgi:hypothetical protein